MIDQPPARIDIPRLIMLPKHYDTDSLHVYLSEMRRAEREMNTRIRDRRIKPTYRRRTRTALRGIVRERRAIEQELAKRERDIP